MLNFAKLVYDLKTLEHSFIVNECMSCYHPHRKKEIHTVIQNNIGFQVH